MNINKFTNHIQLLKVISANMIGTSQPAILSFNILDIKRDISAIKDDPHIFYIIGISIMILLIVMAIAISCCAYTGYKTQFSLTKLGNVLHVACLKVKPKLS